MTAISTGITGKYSLRVPDAEPGLSRLWNSYQYPLLHQNQSLVPSGEHEHSLFELLKIIPGVEDTDVYFPELGYAKEARLSYGDSFKWWEAGKNPAGINFQVSLPTPFAVIFGYIEPDS